MTAHAPELAAVVARLEKMERQYGRLKAAGAAVFAVAVAGLLMGQTLPKGRTMEAEEFVLRDSAGARLAVLHPIDGLPVLTFFDRTGEPRAALRLWAFGTAELRLSGQTGQGQGWLSLGVDKQGAGLTVFGAGGGTDNMEFNAASLRVLKGKERPLPILTLSRSIGEGLSARPESLILTDAELNSRAVFGRSELVTKRTGVVSKRPLSSLVLFNEDGTVVFKAPWAACEMAPYGSFSLDSLRSCAIL